MISSFTIIIRITKKNWRNKKKMSYRLLLLETPWISCTPPTQIDTSVRHREIYRVIRNALIIYPYPIHTHGMRWDQPTNKSKQTQWTIDRGQCPTDQTQKSQRNEDGNLNKALLSLQANLPYYCCRRYKKKWPCCFVTRGLSCCSKLPSCLYKWSSWLVLQ